jgi:putative membrane protein
MKNLALKWIVLALAVFGASLITKMLNLGFQVDIFDAKNAVVPGKVITLFLGVAVLAFLNATLGKILKFLTLPLSCLTLGLFSLVVNAIVLMVAASFKLGFMITQAGFDGFMAAAVASILISLINGLLGLFLPDPKDG